MNKEQVIHYEPHPVSAERKAELRAQGLTIIDAAFKPVDADEALPSEAAPKMTVAELREALDAKGVDIPEGAKKADLQALLDASE